MPTITGSADISPTSEKYFGIRPQDQKGELSMETFMRLLTVQLANQNPLEPMNDRDFFAQMAQLGQVQGLDQVKKSMDVSQAASLMGKEITAVRTMTQAGSNGMNSLVNGVVRGLSIRQGEYLLQVEEANGGIVEVKMGSIQAITQ